MTKDDIWCERKLTPFPFTVKLVLNKDYWPTFCEAHDIKDLTWINEESAGDVQLFDGLAVVRFIDMSHKTLASRVGVYAHEATHVFQNLCSRIGEWKPGSEMEAYFIQHITSWLFTECEEYWGASANLDLDSDD